MLRLRYLAEEVADECEDVDVSIEGQDRKTLVVHTTDQQADRVRSLLEERGARTEREWYDEDDVRILAVPS